MATATTAPTPLLDSKIKGSPGRLGAIIFGLALAGGAIYSGWKLISDISKEQTSSAWPFVLLGIALVIALGFEFVNGFHDTANAVATVIYTHTLEPHLAVVWSGVWNFAGVLTSSGAVAFTVVSLLPVEHAGQIRSRVGGGSRASEPAYARAGKGGAKTEFVDASGTDSAGKSNLRTKSAARHARAAEPVAQGYFAAGVRL